MSLKEILHKYGDRYTDELVELLRMPSISAADAHVGDVEKA